VGSNRKDYLISFSVLHFFDFCVQFEIQNQEPANPHEIKENEETSFVVQTQGVQIAKDVSICVFDRWIRTPGIPAEGWWK